MHRFIVGTGRCGSTMLSEMLADHPDLLVFSEFFSTIDREGAFRQSPAAGRAFAEVLRRPHLINDLIGMRNSLLNAQGAAKFTRELTDEVRNWKSLPGLHLGLSSIGGADTETLVRDTLAFVETFPVRHFGEHYRAMFAWLAQRLGRSAGWLERSGTSIELLGRYADFFPGARFVHIHRHGPSVALSLRAHRYIGLFASYHLDPPDAQEIERTLFGPVGGEDDPVIQRLTTKLPSIERFGEYWSWMLTRGMRDLHKVNPENYLPIRYEDLVARPQATLTQIAQFFGLRPDDNWLQKAAVRVDSEASADRLTELDPTIRAALEKACRPGQVLLGREDADGLDPTFFDMRAALAARGRLSI